MVYKHTLREITGNFSHNSKDIYIRNDIIEAIILSSRGAKDSNDNLSKEAKESRRREFRTLLGIKEHDIFIDKEQSVTKSIMKTFKKQNIYTQYSILNYKIDVYFLDHELAIEIDEEGHTDRDQNKEKEN